MVEETDTLYTGFLGVDLIARGSLTDVADALKQRLDGGMNKTPMIFEDASGRRVELDWRGSAEDVRARVAAVSLATQSGQAVRRAGPGRPKLGVVSREISLMPRHWDWLNEQPGGASVALRKLVEEARRQNQGKDRLRRAQEALHKFMYIMTGDLPGFEEASRAFYAKDYSRFEQLILAWPTDVREHLLRLLEVYRDCDRLVEAETAGPQS